MLKKNDFLITRLSELEPFTEPRMDVLTAEEIYEWVSECYVFFETINLAPAIINKFMGAVNLETIAIAEGKIGAFTGMSGGYIWTLSEAKKNDVKIAFKLAHEKVKRINQERNLVPQWLLDSLSGETDAKLFTLVSSVESAYERDDPKLIVANANTLLDEVLDYEPSLKAKMKIGTKLQSLYESQPLQKYFGVTKDLVCGLNNSRVIRNESIHPTGEKLIDIPLLVATSYAYLVIMFFITASSAGVIDHKEV